MTNMNQTGTSGGVFLTRGAQCGQLMEMQSSESVWRNKKNDGGCTYICFVLSGSSGQQVRDDLVREFAICGLAY